MLHPGRTLLLLSAWTLLGCTHYPPVRAWDAGGLVVRAPLALRAVQVIPEGTRRIEVRVSGAGIPPGSVLSATLTPERNEVLFGAVPAGPKVIGVKAFDAEGAVVAQGQADVTIVAGATIAARIRLSLTTDQGQFNLVLE